MGSDPPGAEFFLSRPGPSQGPTKRATVCPAQSRLCGNRGKVVAGAESPVRLGRGGGQRRNNCLPRHLLSDSGHSPNSGVAGHNCWPPLTCKSPSAFFPVASTPLQDKVLVGSFHQPQLQRIFQQHFLRLQPHLEELCAASGEATYLSSLPLPSQPVFAPLLLLPPNLPSAAAPPEVCHTSPNPAFSPT